MMITCPHFFWFAIVLFPASKRLSHRNRGIENRIALIKGAADDKFRELADIYVDFAVAVTEQQEVDRSAECVRDSDECVDARTLSACFNVTDVSRR